MAFASPYCYQLMDIPKSSLAHVSSSLPKLKSSISVLQAAVPFSLPCFF